MSLISIRATEKEKKLIQQQANFEGMSLSDYIKSAVLEKIDNDYDLALGLQALSEFESEPVTYTINEMKKKYNLK